MVQKKDYDKTKESRDFEASKNTNYSTMAQDHCKEVLQWLTEFVSKNELE